MFLGAKSGMLRSKKGYIQPHGRCISTIILFKINVAILVCYNDIG